jgi:multidrug efflux pump subunit AcrB
MMFMTGIIGRFMFSFPFVITITLLASLVVSLTIVPALTLAFQGGKQPKENAHHPELASGSPEF